MAPSLAGVGGGAAWRLSEEDSWSALTMVKSCMTADSSKVRCLSSWSVTMSGSTCSSQSLESVQSEHRVNRPRQAPTYRDLVEVDKVQGVQVG